MDKCECCECQQTGTKYDEGKIRYGLLPWLAIDAAARVMTFGATKYGDRNWEQGFAAERLISAAMRHLRAYMRNEIYDEETGEHHLAHAICNIAMLHDLDETDGLLPEVEEQT